MSRIVSLYKPEYRQIMKLNPVLYLDRKYSGFDVVRTNPLGQWNDISGNGYHATQSTVSARPILTPEGVSFDGVNDMLLLPTNSDVNFGRYSVFSIYAEVDWDNNRSEIYSNRSSVPGEVRGYRFVLAPSAVRALIWFSPQDGSVEYIHNLSGRQKVKVCWTCGGAGNGSDFILYMNGAQVATGTAGTHNKNFNPGTQPGVYIGYDDWSVKYATTNILRKAIFNYELTSQQAIDLTS